jgi:HEAT repeat protein
METNEIRQLVQHLADVATPLAVARLYALSDLSYEGLEEFRRVWPHIPVQRRRQIVGFLIDIMESSFEVDFESVLCVCLGDSDEEVRSRSVAGLWESEDVSLVAPLLEMARNDPSARARAAAVGVLGQFVLLGELGRISSGCQAGIEDVLLALFRSPDESVEVRRRAVEALAYSSREEVHGIIESAYYDGDQVMRVAAVFAMGRNLDPQWEPLLMDELRSHDPELRYEAARACGELELAPAIPQLAELLNDEDREVHEASIWALGQIGSQKARHILEAHYEALGAADRALRDAVEEALSELALNSGAIQFPLYEYDVDAERDVDSWADDWLSDVLDDGVDETAFDGFDDD